MPRILVIEDNPANMKLACLLLRNAGHSVLQALDAESGLTLALAEQPDLILMDIQLPGMDGLAATALLKRDPATAAIPVVALTAMAMKADREKTRVAGCDGYIAKPLRYQELYAVIERLLGLHADPGASKATSAVAAPTPSIHDVPMPDADSADGERRLILVAEDNPSSQKLILRQLALLGFHGEVASNGRLALTLWQSGRFALLLCDLHMPEMDGHELIAAIRAGERDGDRRPIVVMSASAVGGDGERERSADMDDYLSKPLQLAELAVSLHALLPTPGGMPPAFECAPATVGPAQAVAIDVLADLVGHDPATVREFLHDFRRCTPGIAHALACACRSRQPLLASSQAHTLKSSARAVGALALGELCAEMEIAGRAGDADALAGLLPLFDQELRAVDTFLDAFLAGVGTDRDHARELAP